MAFEAAIRADFRHFVCDNEFTLSQIKPVESQYE
jgi:hypothetical protein